MDRGLNCLECVAYLLAMKYQLPNKVFLLRGNHETRDVNGWQVLKHDVVHCLLTCNASNFLSFTSVTNCRSM